MQLDKKRNEGLQMFGQHAVPIQNGDYSGFHASWPVADY